MTEILDAVWENQVITNQFPNLMIRLTSLRGAVSSKLWSDEGNNPDDIQILAVGTVNIPSHLTKYRDYLKEYNELTAKYMDAERGDSSYEVGYDLMSRGSSDARESVLKLFNHHYDFPEEILDSLVTNSAITCGGMRGLKDIADGLIFRAGSSAPHVFIQPDNSFGTWWNIIESPGTQFRDRREVVKIGTSPKNKLHVSPEDVVKYYENNAPRDYESWYLTPVGNPSGTKMSPGALHETCKTILSHNPKAVIILDMVYLRTMPEKSAKILMEGINSDKTVLNNVIFLESFSKSHGLCGERLGIYFSTNEQLFTQIHSSNVAFSAGPGLIKNYQFKALGSIENRKGIEDLHLFWRDEKLGLLSMLKQDKFKHLFDPNQHHITEDDLKEPCTLYLLLKTQPEINAQIVFKETGVLGVDTPLDDGLYIRFSVGTLQKPVFERYTKLAKQN